MDKTDNFTLQQEILIPGVSASKVMAYVGDWDNHKDLNPHIQEWRIEDRDIDNSDKAIKEFSPAAVLTLCFYVRPSSEVTA